MASNLLFRSQNILHALENQAGLTEKFFGRMIERKKSIVLKNALGTWTRHQQRWSTPWPRTAGERHGCELGSGAPLSWIVWLWSSVENTVTFTVTQGGRGGRDEGEVFRTSPEISVPWSPPDWLPHLRAPAVCPEPGTRWGLWSRRQAPLVGLLLGSGLTWMSWGPWREGWGCGPSTRDPRAGSSSVCQLLRVPVTHAGDPGPRGGRAGSFWIGSTPPSGQGPLLEPFPSGSVPALAPLHQAAGGGPGHWARPSVCSWEVTHARGAQPSGFSGVWISPSPLDLIRSQLLQSSPASPWVEGPHLEPPCPSALSPACRKAVLRLCVKVQLSIRVLSSFAISL